MGAFKLEKFQDDAVTEILNEFKNHDTVCLAFYTGSGKTNIFLELAKALLKKNPSAKIGISSYLTTEVKIQTYERSKSLGLGDKTQLIQYQVPILSSYSVFVFNPQTIYNRKAEFKFDYLIVDECHAGLDDDCLMLNKIIAKFTNSKTKKLVVSATPWDILYQKRFEGIPVIKRPMSAGLKDGRVADVEIFCEESQLEFSADDFSRTGSLKDAVLEAKHSLIQSECFGKLKNIISRYDKTLGEKVLVICPPGNNGEVAREMAKNFDGLFFIENSQNTALNSEGNLDKFKSDNTRFLFVINKCQVGFDMPELETVIDLTITRNVKLLVQRIGRVARAHGRLDKKYFYVYDKSLNIAQLEWLIGTTIDLSCGNFEGWATKTVKYRPLNYFNHFRYRPPSVRISEVVKALTKDSSIINTVTLRYTEASPPKKRTLDSAIIEAQPYQNRHDLFKKNPSLYKWFRMHGHIKELDKIHPQKHILKYWNEERVIEAMKLCKSRKEFHKRFAGAASWVSDKKRNDLIEKHLPPSKNAGFSRAEITEIFSKVTRWGEIRKHYPILRSFLNHNKDRERFYKALFAEMHPIAAAAKPGRPITDSRVKAALKKKLIRAFNKGEQIEVESRKEFYRRMVKIRDEKAGRGHEKKTG